MSTRSLTIVRGIEHNREEEICVIYRHMDGYPEGHGAELQDFARHYKITNGIAGDNHEKSANGPHDLAAQLVTFFKNQWPLGNIYLYPAGSRDMGEEYTYIVTASESAGVVVECLEHAQ